MPRKTSKSFFYYGSLKIWWADWRICGLPKQGPQEGSAKEGRIKIRSADFLVGCGCIVFFQHCGGRWSNTPVLEDIIRESLFPPLRTVLPDCSGKFWYLDALKFSVCPLGPVSVSHRSMTLGCPRVLSHDRKVARVLFPSLLQTVRSC